MTKNPNAVALGSLGGRARAKKLTAEQRFLIAQAAGRASKGKKKHPKNGNKKRKAEPT